MANLNQAPRMGETDDDDSNESSDLQPVFLDAAFEADKRAKERAFQEENQRRILEFLDLGSENDDDEDDEKDSKSSKSKAAATDSKTTAPDPVKTEQPASVQPEAPANNQTAEEQQKVPSEQLEPEQQVDAVEGETVAPEAAVSEPEMPNAAEYDMASEVVEEESETPVATHETAAEDLPQPDVPDIKPTVAAAQVESVFNNEWTPNQGEGAADFDPDSKAEKFEETSMDEEPVVPETPPEPEGGFNNPPPPPEEPEVENFDDFDTPPPPPDSEAEPQPEEPPAEEVIETRREVVDNYRGGVGAALLAFFAANWLSRRRDRKLRREAQKLEKQFKKSQEQAKAERSFARENQRKTESQRHEQAAKLARLERAQEQQLNQPAAEKSAAERQEPVPVAEVLAAAAYTSKNQTPENPTNDKTMPADERLETLPPEQQESYKSNGYIQPEYQPPAAESGREIDYERQKEAPPDPIMHSADTVSIKESGRLSALDAAQESLSRRDQSEDTLYQVAMPESAADDADLYHKSIAAGVAVGVAVVVLAAALYFLMF